MCCEGEETQRTVPLNGTLSASEGFQDMSNLPEKKPINYDYNMPLTFFLAIKAKVKNWDREIKMDWHTP